MQTSAGCRSSLALRKQSYRGKDMSNTKGRDEVALVWVGLDVSSKCGTQVGMSVAFRVFHSEAQRVAQRSEETASKVQFLSCVATIAQ